MIMDQSWPMLLDMPDLERTLRGAAAGGVLPGAPSCAEISAHVRALATRQAQLSAYNDAAAQGVVVVTRETVLTMVKPAEYGGTAWIMQQGYIAFEGTAIDERVMMLQPR